ncbi:unnamed protein product [Prorocentrum cordatum]|uniref:Peptidase A1 domain-containing protein n=1 Tax=Prorocentrum cordatum TaxID=2364126 RepID=A0ABN9S466_9DINO|nr:unnamed protein product [Polarella glacialis]
MTTRRRRRRTAGDGASAPAGSALKAAMPCLWALAPVLLARAGSSAPREVASGLAPARSLGFDLRMHRPERPREAAGPPAGGGTLATGRRLRGAVSHACDLGNYDNVQYHLEISVGEPCDNSTLWQKFQVVPDTGSSDLWVPAENCTRCKGKTKKFHLNQSCTAKELGDRITFRYGDGTMALGGSFEDTIIIGDLTVKHQFLIQVDKMESDTHMKSDGILGLAHHYVSDKTSRGPTFMKTLFQEHPHLTQQFSFYLTGTTEQQSRLIFGEANLTAYSKETKFQYGKGYYMTHTSLWLTSVWSIGWGGTGVEKDFPDKGTLGSPALIDSGSSLIVLAPDIYDHLLAELRWVNARAASGRGTIGRGRPSFTADQTVRAP